MSEGFCLERLEPSFLDVKTLNINLLCGCLLDVYVWNPLINER
jgi:hypothetical protein